MAFKNKEILFGLFDDETQLLAAVADAKHAHIEIDNVYTPFPVHGLDPLLGLEESRLHIAGFFYGLTGTLTAFFGMTWIFTRDWPTIFGGKPYFSFPAFVPIIFELTVLFASIGMVVTFYTVCGLGPGVKVIQYNDKGNEILLGLFSSGETFGEPPLIANKPYPSYAVAYTNVKL